jgi:hypothetical protein
MSTAFKHEEKIPLTNFLFPMGENIAVEVGGQTVLVHSLIPYETLFTAIQEVINTVTSQYGYISSGIQQVTTDMTLLKYFTNLDINILNLDTYQVYSNYDIIKPHIKPLLAVIDQEQLEFFYVTIDRTIESICSFRNSVSGLLDAVTDNTKNTMGDIAALQDQISNPDTLKTIQEIMKTVSQPST